jgi:hypothetical protein
MDNVQNCDSYIVFWLTIVIYFNMIGIHPVCVFTMLVIL